MRVRIDDVEVEILGDSHLGKRFVNGVPLHRRGEREAMVRRDFEASLERACDADLHLMVGDIMDKAVVPYETIAYVADTYDRAASKNPRTVFVILRGNHDQGRDEEAVTAFDLFSRMVEHLSNIEVIHQPAGFPLNGVPFSFFPWSSQAPLEDIVRFAEPKGTCFFHADVDPITGPDNLIPTKALAELGITRAFTGHVHKPHEFTRDGVHVTVVGSLQPFAHGEEADDSLYVTIPRSEIWQHDAAELKDKVVRVDLEPGQPRDVDLDCLQLTYRSQEERKDDVKVELGEIDLPKLTAEVLAEVRPSVRDKILDTLIQQRMR